jgi:hypothetical protein
MFFQKEAVVPEVAVMPLTLIIDGDEEEMVDEDPVTILAGGMADNAKQDEDSIESQEEDAEEDVVEQNLEFKADNFAPDSEDEDESEEELDDDEEKEDELVN